MDLTVSSLPLWNSTWKREMANSTMNGGVPFRAALQARPELCPPNCHVCQDVCEREAKQGAPAAIRVVATEGASLRRLVYCKQCLEPKCREVCPAGAIGRDPATGVLKVDASRCVGCTLCTIACRYGGITFDRAANTSSKCETCNGDFRCAQACPTDALTVSSNSTVAAQLPSDPLNKGNFLCPGCAAELSLRFALRVLGPKAVLTTTSGCATLASGGMGDDRQLENAATRGLMNDVAAIMTGVSRYYRRIGKEAIVTAFVGDGAAADVGFQALSGAAERGEDLLFICYDNEGYMNTGIQRSSTTPLLGWTNTTPVGKAAHGKTQHPKNMPLIMAFHGAAYVATASPAYLEDFARKLEKARDAKHGLSYLHVLTPCVTGWKAPPETGIELARAAVDTNYYPLWEFENGVFRFTYTPKAVRPIQDLTTAAGRFRHLTPTETAGFQDYVNARFNTIRYLTQAADRITT